MSRLHEISCKSCGSSISLSEEWDRTSYDLRPQDRVLRRCLMCGGEMLFYKRWIDPPATHPQCTDGRWSDTPCAMCFGPMLASAEGETARTFHDRCGADNWHQKACEVCRQPMPVHVDWEDPPARHRGCETEQWYEKGCKYCGSTLKIHVSWQDPPAAHRECEPIEVPDYTRPDNDFQVAAETNGSFAEDELIPYQASDRRTASNGASEAYGPVADNGWRSNGYQTDQFDMSVPAHEEQAFIPEIDPSESEAHAFDGNAFDANAYEPDRFDLPISSFDLPITGIEEEELTSPHDMADDETVEETLDRCCDEPAVPDFLMMESRNFAASDDEATADEYPVEQSVDQAPAADDLCEAKKQYPADETAQTDDEAAAATPEMSHQASDHERYCSRCGKPVAHTEAFHISNGGVRDEAGSICRECQHDGMLVSGAVAAMRKKMPFELNVASELRTFTRPVTLVTNAETGEAIAEVMLVETGTFSPDRAAVAYDPLTEERFSKTVFGHKGLFSSLRTADTYDRNGRLIHRARHGGELALAANGEDSGEHAVQVDQNRFFLKKR